MWLKFQLAWLKLTSLNKEPFTHKISLVTAITPPLIFEMISLYIFPNLHVTKNVQEQRILPHSYLGRRAKKKTEGCKKNLNRISNFYWSHARQDFIHYISSECHNCTLESWLQNGTLDSIISHFLLFLVVEIRFYLIFNSSADDLALELKNK